MNAHKWKFSKMDIKLMNEVSHNLMEGCGFLGKIFGV